MLMVLKTWELQSTALLVFILMQGNKCQCLKYLEIEFKTARWFVFFVSCTSPTHVQFIPLFKV